MRRYKEGAQKKWDTTERIAPQAWFSTCNATTASQCVFLVVHKKAIAVTFTPLSWISASTILRDSPAVTLPALIGLALTTWAWGKPQARHPPDLMNMRRRPDRCQRRSLSASSNGPRICFGTATLLFIWRVTRTSIKAQDQSAPSVRSST